MFVTTNIVVHCMVLHGCLTDTSPPLCVLLEICVSHKVSLYATLCSRSSDGQTFILFQSSNLTRIVLKVQFRQSFTGNNIMNYS